MATEKLDEILRPYDRPTQQTLNFNPKAERSLREWLERRFGLGDDPRKRRILYGRIATAYAYNAELTLLLISEAEMMSLSTSVPEAKQSCYFCRAISAKLRDHGRKLGMVREGDTQSFRA